MKHFEVNFDGLVGPTHNYAGLSYGNVASQSNAKEASNPKEAAKQGLRKMKALTDLGMVQGVLAPQERTGSRDPAPPGLHRQRCQRPGPGRQTGPRRAGRLLLRLQHVDRQRRHRLPERRHPGWPHSLHPANLTNKFHRSLEPEVTGRILRAVFNNDRHFYHHQHLPENDHFGDEGAANHTGCAAPMAKRGRAVRLWPQRLRRLPARPKRYPARQTLEASQAIARLHGLGMRARSSSSRTRT